MRTHELPSRPHRVTISSIDPLQRVSQGLEKQTDRIASWCFSSDCTGVAGDRKSQSRMDPSNEPDATGRPSGEKHDDITPGGPAAVVRGMQSTLIERCASTSQTRIVPSNDDDATVVRWGASATYKTLLVCTSSCCPRTCVAAGCQIPQPERVVVGYS